MLTLIKILDCHSSHRPTQCGQAKSCQKSDCLMIIMIIVTLTLVASDLPARRPAPQQSCAPRAGRGGREAWHALPTQRVDRGKPLKIFRWGTNKQAPIPRPLLSWSSGRSRSLEGCGQGRANREGPHTGNYLSKVEWMQMWESLGDIGWREPACCRSSPRQARRAAARPRSPGGPAPRGLRESSRRGGDLLK